MSEIKKLEVMVSNARKWKSPELRFTFLEAEQLLKEIQDLQTKLISVPQQEVNPPVRETKTIHLDGGGF